jgi:hypothetical protein
LKRVFGREEKIADCDWSFLSTVRSTAEPHEPMPRLKDVLEYLAKPENEKIWLLLDIKVRRINSSMRTINHLTSIREMMIQICL